MPLNISNITPASIKAKNVATEEYVDTGLANIDVSGDIANNNEIFAQKLGYSNYATMVAAASAGNTVINGGYINTGLLQVGSVTASKINTDGLIAENISATDIIGKNIIGSTLKGAYITGSTIKASYLDLDGELSLLTDFYLVPGTDTSNVPAEAITEGRYLTNYVYNTSHTSVYMTTSGLYRIPSLSTVRFPSEKADPGLPIYTYTFDSYGTTVTWELPIWEVGTWLELHGVRSYRDYLTQHQNKIRKTSSIQFDALYASNLSILSIGYNKANAGMCYEEYAGATVDLYCFGTYMLTCYYQKVVNCDGNSEYGKYSLSGAVTQSTRTLTTASGGTSSAVHTFNFYGIPFRVKAGTEGLSVSILSSSFVVDPVDIPSDTSIFKAQVTAFTGKYAYNPSITLSSPADMIINNQL